MDESSSWAFNTDNSISSKEASLSTNTSFEKFNPIYYSENLKKYVIKSISQNLNEIIKEKYSKSKNKKLNN